MDGLTLAFIPIAALLTVTPGSDTMLVVNNTLTRSTSDGLCTVAGINAGLIVHAMASAFGLSMILMNSATAFEFVKLAGALYIIYLGVQSLRRSRSSEEEQSTIVHSQKRSISASIREGFLTNVLNPKVAVFYLALLPQFISPADNLIEKSFQLMIIHLCMGILWFSFITLALGKMRPFISGNKFKKRLEAISGVVFIALGLKMALSKN
ncbi:resistance to homoserine/threonine (RhtB) family protein [Maridesulfovibrio ferrireducens]|uniref:Resistance to homoserine/threonine (RhtB) family protein n=1 Tax=Maridesulfovibrio ferrireducens TaxID=246191 RepID=A0A1G9FFX9_9BACT|nr:LysE family translocator [Maridesulfovibrio ferrireducens]SDK87246.1 resistance to homoserine/threonine (RhtB) family protein [Maridesulfovibrio ferrireducens]